MVMVIFMAKTTKKSYKKKSVEYDNGSAATLISCACTIKLITLQLKE